MERDDGKKKNKDMIATCVVWTLLCLTCMAVMLAFALNKTIVIADVSQEQSGVSVNQGQSDQTSPDSLLAMENASGVRGSFSVPLPKGIRAENVTVENRYMDRELLLYIQGGEEDFYRENPISGDMTPVLTGLREEQTDGIILRFQMNRVLEYLSTMEGSTLTIKWYEPGELYDYIIVLDPAGGGSESGISDDSLREKDVVLQVARQVQRQFNIQNTRLYCTRTEDVDVDPEARIGLAEEVGADLYVRLSLSADGESADTYGITGIYNEDYYIPGFGNLAMADLLTREVTIFSSNRAAGLKAADEESILRQVRIPAAEVSLGFLSNPQEEYLLGQESYQENLAKGILEALSKAVAALEEMEGQGGETLK